MATQFKDLLLDPVTGDLDFGGPSNRGLFLVMTNQISLRQRLYLRFSIWFSDWYFDESFGFPYRTFIGRKTMKDVLDGRIKSEVRQEVDVVDILDFTSRLVDRTYSCYFTVLTEEGQEVNLALQGGDRFIYPTPPESNAQLCGPSPATISFNNKEYQLVNFSLPGYSPV